MKNRLDFFKKFIYQNKIYLKKFHEEFKELAQILGLFFISLVIIFLLTGAKPKALSLEEKSIECNEVKPQRVLIEPGKITILSFPLPPKEVLPGSGIFDFKQIRNDLAIKSMGNMGHTNVVIYVDQRRCVFDIRSVSKGGQDVLIVRDPKDSLIDLELK